MSNISPTDKRTLGCPTYLQQYQLLLCTSVVLLLIYGIHIMNEHHKLNICIDFEISLQATL